MLDLVEEALDAVAVGVGLPTDGALDLAVRFGRDNWLDAPAFEVVPDGIAVIAFVGEHGDGIGRVLIHEVVIGCHVRGLAGCHAEADRETLRIRSGMNLGREPTARTANTVSLNPPLPPAAC